MKTGQRLRIYLGDRKFEATYNYYIGHNNHMVNVQSNITIDGVKKKPDDLVKVNFDECKIEEL